MTKVAGLELNPSKSNMQKTQLHEACSFSYIILRCDDQSEPTVVYRGTNAAKLFFEALQKEEANI